MIYGGVFQRFPDLKLVSVESGVGWFAFAADYMDETWDKQRYWVNSLLEHTPSYFMERNIYGSFIHDRAGILCATSRARAISCGLQIIRTPRRHSQSLRR